MRNNISYSQIGIAEWLYNVGIEAAEVMPILLFIGIGAMIDFAPLLSRPILFLFGFAAQFGIFVVAGLSLLLGFDLKDAFSIGVIGAAGISAFPMSSRVIQKLALDEDPTNVLIMHAAGANVAGQIGSAVIGGLMMSIYTYLR